MGTTKKMRVHALKTWPAYWDATAAGLKIFEIRKDDRGYSVHDVLLLRKYDPETRAYLPPKIAVVVTYRTEPACPFLPPGYVAMSVRAAEYYETVEALRTLYEADPQWESR